MKLETLLCFDYGEKRIGIAIGQTLTGTASALATINAQRDKPDWNKISEIICQWQPQALVVGVPLTMDGERQALTKRAEKFSRQLHHRFYLPVYLADERLTSFEARQRLKTNNRIDAVAAQVILESWLRDNKDLTTAGVTMPRPLHAQENE